MNKKLVLLTLLLTAVISGIYAQPTKPCGVEGELRDLLQERFLANKASFLEAPYVQQRDITYVPVTFHATAQSTGLGRVSVSDILDQLCELNEDFLGMNMQFYIKQINEVNNNAIYDNPGATASNFLMVNSRDDSAVNIWVTQNATNSNVTPPGTVTLGYYDPDPTADWIVIRKSETNGASTTLSHEMGHFFSLLHPHNGWEVDPWEPGDMNPVATFAPNGFALNEKQDGSNCENAGDLVCDTPPDYNGIFWPDCDFTGGAMDPDGVLIDPEESNYMSYFGNCPLDDYHFSDMQQALMIQNLNSSERNYVNPGNVPSLTEITQTPELVAPASGETIDGFNFVVFEWAPVSGADRYLVEVDETPDFAGNDLRSYISFGNTKLVEDLDANESYFWRVRPFSPYRTCTNFTPTRNFSTGEVVSTRTLSQVNRWTVHPNPVKTGDELTVSIEAKESFAAQVRLFSLSGQLLRTGRVEQLAAGENRLQLPVEALKSGVYLLSLRAGEQEMSTRVIITE